MTPNDFMAHLTQALKHKTGLSGLELRVLVRRCYGIVVPLIKKYPDELEALALDIDYLMPGKLPSVYVAQIRALVQDMQQGHRAADARRQRTETRPVSVSTALESLKHTAGRSAGDRSTGVILAQRRRLPAVGGKP